MTDLLGPLPAFNFFVALIEDGDSAVQAAAALGSAFWLGGFTEATGLESELEVQEFTAGGVNDRVFRFPTRARYPNLVLSRGVGFSEELYLWHEGFLMGEGKRRDGIVFLANELGVPVKAWTFEKGIPVKWSGPALNAGTSATSIERLEISHEKLSLTLSPGKALDSLTGAIGL